MNEIKEIIERLKAREPLELEAFDYADGEVDAKFGNRVDGFGRTSVLFDAYDLIKAFVAGAKYQQNTKLKSFGEIELKGESI